MAYGTRQLVDRILDGHLDDYLRDARARGQSYDTISKRLLAEFDLDCSREQIRKWSRQLETPVGA